MFFMVKCVNYFSSKARHKSFSEASKVVGFTEGAGLWLDRIFQLNQWKKSLLKSCKNTCNSGFFYPEHYNIDHGIKIKPLLHCCFAIRPDILLAAARKISARIAKQQCNNVLVSSEFLKSAGSHGWARMSYTFPALFTQIRTYV